MKKQLTHFVRRMKPLYWAMNWMNRNLLIQNKETYKRLNIHKSIFMGLQSKDVAHLPSVSLGVDNEAYVRHVLHDENQLAQAGLSAHQVMEFVSNGYLVIPAFLDSQEVEGINQEIEEMIRNKKARFNFTGKKIAFAFKHSALLKRITLNERLLKINALLMGKSVFPYHTLNFIQGSEQAPHSDAVHMGTYPAGGLIAAWIALEDTDESNGPLVYFPGSHTLDYITNDDLDLQESKWLLDENPNQKYEQKIAKILEEKGLKPVEFHAKKGDVLIWHGNLVHGGKKTLDNTRTRKSMVIHYLREDSLCWHELSQRPALVEKIR